LRTPVQGTVHMVLICVQYGYSTFPVLYNPTKLSHQTMCTYHTFKSTMWPRNKHGRTMPCAHRSIYLLSISMGAWAPMPKEVFTYFLFRTMTTYLLIYINKNYKVYIYFLLMLFDFFHLQCSINVKKCSSKWDLFFYG
jgi:hypothetical protein